jgi:hypothetical protein
MNSQVEEMHRSNYMLRGVELPCPRTPKCPFGELQRLHYIDMINYIIVHSLVTTSTFSPSPQRSGWGRVRLKVSIL